MRKSRTLLVFFSLLITFSTKSTLAKTVPPSEISAFATVIENHSPHEVAVEILKNDPHALVLAPEGDAKEIAAEPPKSDTIQEQKADMFTTVLIALSFGYESTVYLISPHYSWLQSLSMNGFNFLNMTKLDLKLGKWSSLLQTGGKGFSKAATKLGIVSEEKWQKRTETLGNYLTHWTLCYAYYALLQTMSELPNLRDGLFSGHAQLNAVRKTSSGFLSGFGWTMLARKWDALPDEERPISRQAFSAFNALRGMVTGIFIPILVSTPNNATFGEFVLRNSPFFISAATGTVFYFFGDPILRRYPQIGRALERFDDLTVKLDGKMISARDKFNRYRERRRRLCTLFMNDV